MKKEKLVICSSTIFIRRISIDKKIKLIFNVDSEKELLALDH